MEEKSDVPEKAPSAILPPKKSEKACQDASTIDCHMTTDDGKDNEEDGANLTTTAKPLPDEDNKPKSVKDKFPSDEGEPKATIAKPESDGDESTVIIAKPQPGEDELEGAIVQPQSGDEDDLKKAIVLSMTAIDNNGEKLQGATAVSATDKPPSDKEVINRIKGVLYGNCIGDAIGLLTEFMDKEEAEMAYGARRLLKVFDTKDLEYNQKVDDRHRCNWEFGDWTDDSDQMILILRTLVENNGKFDEKDFARKLKHWVRHGYSELGDTGGCGLGRTTASVLSHTHFLHDPHKAARDVWEHSGKFIAPNGGVMRTSVLGTMEFNNLEKVIKNTRNACMVTHADPRCIASCVAVTISIALMLQGKHMLNNGEQDVERIMKIAHSRAEKEITIPEHKEELKQHMFSQSLDKLELDAPRAIGYTFKCMGAGFWAFRQKNFRQAIQAITMEAGDADTNCAVAGALLGCKVGFDKLPQSWVTGLYHRKWLDNEIKSYFALLGLRD